MTRTFWNMVVAAVFFLGLSVSAQLSLESVASVTPGKVSSGTFFEVGGKRYAAIGQGNQLIIADFSSLGTSAASPSKVASVDLDTNVNHVEVVGSMLYAAVGTSGMAIIDASDPANPVLKATVPTRFQYGGEALDIAIAGSYAYVAAKVADLVVVDISDATSPQPVDTLSFGGQGFGIVSDGSGNVYVATKSGPRVVSVNATNPESTWVQATGSMDEYALDIAISGNYAFAAAGNDGIQVFNISDPSNVTAVTKYSEGMSKISKILVDGDYIYAADPDSGLVIVDISTPASPSYTASIRTVRTPLQLSKLGDYVIVAEDSYGAEIFDVSDPSAPTVAATWRVPGYAINLALNDTYAAIAIGQDGLEIIDISDPTQPSVAEILSLEGEVRSTFISNDTISIADGTKYRHVRINGSDFTKGITIPSGGRAQDAIRDGDHGYIATDEGFRIVGSAFIFGWESKGTYRSPGSGTALDKVGDYVYLADGDSGISIVDVSNPGNLTTVLPATSTLPITGASARDIKVKGTYAYVAGLERGLVVIDVSDVSAPEIKAELSLGVGGGYASGLAISGDTLYLAARSKIHVIDIADPLNPSILLSGASAANEALNIAVGNGYIFAAEAGAGLQIYKIADLSPAQRPVAAVTDAFPVASVVLDHNSVRFSLGAAVPVGIRVFGLNGRSVVSVPSRLYAAGAHQVGVGTLQPGLYCLQISTEQATITRAFSVLSR